MTLLINLFGGPGAGKSTTATGVFSLLKQHGVNCEYVSEFAKDLAWEERSKTFHNQYYIWGKQYHKLWRVRDDVEVIITDSPLLLALVYGKNMSESFKQAVVDSFNEFDNMNFIINRVKEYNPKGRLQTEDEAIELDNESAKIVEKYAGSWRAVSGNCDGINDIVHMVLKRLGKGEPTIKTIVVRI